MALNAENNLLPFIEYNPEPKVQNSDFYEYTEGKTEQKNQFIELRVKGYSYRKIAKELNISTGTLTVWDRESCRKTILQQN